MNTSWIVCDSHCTLVHHCLDIKDKLCLLISICKQAQSSISSESFRHDSICWNVKKLDLFYKSKWSRNLFQSVKELTLKDHCSRPSQITGFIDLDRYKDSLQGCRKLICYNPYSLRCTNPQPTPYLKSITIQREYDNYLQRPFPFYLLSPTLEQVELSNFEPNLEIILSVLSLPNITDLSFKSTSPIINHHFTFTLPLIRQNFFHGWNQGRSLVNLQSLTLPHIPTLSLCNVESIHTGWQIQKLDIQIGSFLDYEWNWLCSLTNLKTLCISLDHGVDHLYDFPPPIFTLENLEVNLKHRNVRGDGTIEQFFTNLLGNQTKLKILRLSTYQSCAMSQIINVLDVKRPHLQKITIRFSDYPIDINPISRTIPAVQPLNSQLGVLTTIHLTHCNIIDSELFTLIANQPNLVHVGLYWCDLLTKLSFWLLVYQCPKLCNLHIARKQDDWQYDTNDVPEWITKNRECSPCLEYLHATICGGLWSILPTAPVLKDIYFSSDDFKQIMNAQRFPQLESFRFINGHTPSNLLLSLCDSFCNREISTNIKLIFKFKSNKAREEFFSQLALNM